MAEEAKKEGEGQNLNPEGGEPTWTNGGDQKGKEGEKTTFTLEEVEAMKAKMQSDGDKWVQKLIQKQQLMEKALDAVPKISDDPSYLVTLHETEPDVAETILKRFYDGKSIEKYMEDEGIELDMSDPERVKRRIAQEAQKLADERIISEKKEEFIKELKMTPDEQALFEAEFEERRNLKTFNPKDLRKHFEKAYREANGEPPASLKSAEELARATSSGNWKSWDTGSQPVSATKKSVDSFFDKFL